MQLGATDYSSMSNSDIDAAYAAAYATYKADAGNAAQVNDAVILNAIGQEIITRQQNPTAFVTNLWDSFTGSSPFPQFDAIQATIPGGFVGTTVAATSVQQSASNLTSGITSGLMSSPLVWMAAGVAALLVFLKRK